MRINRGKLRLPLSRETELQNLLKLAEAIEEAPDEDTNAKWDNGLFATFAHHLPPDDLIVVGKLTSADNPEEIFLEKERAEVLVRKYSQLSFEARQVVDMIVNAPGDFFAMLGCKTANGAKPDRIVETLGRKYWNKFFARNVVNEITEFVQAF